jgi:hypothetical protein
MWGINPFTVGKILAGVGLSSGLLGKHGSVKLLSRKMKLYVSEQHADAAKAMARSIATQDRSLYEKLKHELENELTPEQYQSIFGD